MSPEDKKEADDGGERDEGAWGRRIQNLISVLIAIGMLAAMLGAYLPKIMPLMPHNQTPCTTTQTGTECPYADDEPHEYIENFYSRDYGSAGGGNLTEEDQSKTKYWNAQLVSKIDQKPEDTMEQDIVVQDNRDKDKNQNIHLQRWMTIINKETALNITEGNCQENPHASCITLVDFVPPSEDKQIGGYSLDKGPHEREIAISPEVDPTQRLHVMLHEGGHALGLSHKHRADGVMSYHGLQSHYSEDELEALKRAYGS